MSGSSWTAMDTPLDRQFRRAVEIVQGLPKVGPIQTGYEEKLAMYSLYKQATDGDVKTSRPAMWDMLGRAKWDAWEQRKGLPQDQAKLLYVEQLQKVLRKYSDRTVARDLVRELDSYNTDPSIVALSASLTRTPYDARSSSSSGSSRSASPVQVPIQPHVPEPQRALGLAPQPAEMEEDNLGPSVSERGENDHLAVSPPGPSTIGRPQSSASSQMRYRTPLGSTYGFTHISSSSVGPSPGPSQGQVTPRYPTPSAFANQHPGPLPPPPGSTASYPVSSSYPQHLSMTSGSVLGRHYPPAPSSSGVIPPRFQSTSTPLGRSPLEHAVESLQTSLAALHERIEALEHQFFDRSSPIPPSPGAQRSGYGTPSRSPYISSTLSTSPYLPFDPDQMGAWSVFIRPLMRLFAYFQHVMMLFTHPPNPQTSTARLIIVRRLILDTSFALFVLVGIRKAWRASGLRRQALFRALVGVWFALTGKHERVLVDKGV